jgi:hypothetical protein
MKKEYFRKKKNFSPPVKFTRFTPIENSLSTFIKDDFSSQFAKRNKLPEVVLTLYKQRV